MDKKNELYRGKAKTVYATDDPHYLVMHYRDDVSAFDGVKLAQLPLKGELLVGEAPTGTVVSMPESPPAEPAQRP
jgi:phosphoribosylaminoimidazole-succinocarboxamide synthase